MARKQKKPNTAKLEPRALCSCDILHSCYRIFCKMVLNNSWFSFRMQKKQFILFREVMTLNKFQNCKTWETRYRPHYNLRYPHPHPLPLQWRSVSGWGGYIFLCIFVMLAQLGHFGLTRKVKAYSFLLHKS